MMIPNLSRQRQSELVVPFVNDLNALFGELKREIKGRIKNAGSVQDALKAVSVFDEIIGDE